MLIVVFNSRNETIYLAQALRNFGIYPQIINTPKEAGPACGISVKIPENLLPTVKPIISNKPFRSFVGIFRMILKNDGRISLEKIV